MAQFFAILQMESMHKHPLNVENAEAVEYAIIEKMVGADVSDFSFKRIDQTITLASKASVKVDGESI